MLHEQAASTDNSIWRSVLVTHLRSLSLSQKVIRGAPCTVVSKMLRASSMLRHSASGCEAGRGLGVRDEAGRVLLRGRRSALRQRDQVDRLRSPPPSTVKSTDSTLTRRYAPTLDLRHQALGKTLSANLMTRENGRAWMVTAYAARQLQTGHGHSTSAARKAAGSITGHSPNGAAYARCTYVNGQSTIAASGWLANGSNRLRWSAAPDPELTFAVSFSLPQSCRSDTPHTAVASGDAAQSARPAQRLGDELGAVGQAAWA